MDREQTMIGLIGIIVLAILAISVFMGNSNKQKAINNASNEILEHYFKIALHETDIELVSSISKGDYNTLNNNYFNSEFVNRFCSASFTMGFNEGVLNSDGMVLSNHDKMNNEIALSTMANQLYGQLNNYKTTHATNVKVVEAFRNSYQKGVNAGLQQGRYVVVNK
jgi:hypothetical protein